MKPGRTNAKGAARPRGRARNDALSCAISTALRVGSPINVSEIMAWQRHVIKDRRLSPLAIRLAVEMSLSFDRDKQEVIRSHRYFVDMFAAARSNIQKSINEIASYGYLIIISDKRKGFTNRYSLSLPRDEIELDKDPHYRNDIHDTSQNLSKDGDLIYGEAEEQKDGKNDPLSHHSNQNELPGIDYHQGVYSDHKLAFAMIKDHYPPRDGDHLIVNAKDFFFRLCENGEDIEKIVEGASRYSEWAYKAGIVGTKEVIPMWRWLRDRGWEDTRIGPEASSP